MADFGVGGEPLPDMRGPFWAELGASLSPYLSALTFSANNSAVSRVTADVHRSGWAHFWIYREMGPGAWFDFGGSEFRTQPGDLIITDIDTPFRTLATRFYRHNIWMMPQNLVEPHLPVMKRPFAIHLFASDATASLLVAYLNFVEPRFAAMTDPLKRTVADHVARLTGLACGGASKEHRNTLRAAKLEQARQFIEENLVLHELSPDVAAAALGISVRQLHSCFEQAGESFGQYVRRRRLQECRATLEDPIAVGRSITDIAFAWGFSSLPSFYRAFSRAFGVAPGDFRDAVLKRSADRPA